MGIIGPELDLGACLNDNRGTLLDQHRIGDDVVVVLGKNHVLSDEVGQDHTAAHFQIKRCAAAVYGRIPRIETVLAGNGHIQREDIVIGAVGSDCDVNRILPADECVVLDDLAAVVGGVSTHLADGNRRIVDRDIRIRDSGLRKRIHRDGGIRTLTPLVAQEETDGDGFACVDHTVTAIDRAAVQTDRVKRSVVRCANIGVGQNGQCVVNIDDLGQIVRQSHHCVLFGIEAGCVLIACAADLTIDKLGGIGVHVAELAAHQRGNSRHHGCCHGSSAPGSVAVAGDGADHLVTGGVDFVLNAVEGRYVPVGEAGFHTVGVHAHNTDDIAQCCRISRQREIVIGQFIRFSVVTCCGNQHAAGVGSLQRILHQNGGCTAAEGHVDDIRAVFVGVADRFCNITVVEIAACHTGLDGHNGSVVSNTNNTNVVVGGGDDTGNMGTVTLIVHGAASVCHSIVAVVVIHIAVAIIIPAVIRDFTGVDPDVILQILVGIVHTGIDNGNDDTRGGLDGYLVFTLMALTALLIVVGTLVGLLQMVPAALDAAGAQIPLILVVVVALDRLVQIFRTALDDGIARKDIVILCDQNEGKRTNIFHRFVDVNRHIRLVPLGIDRVHDMLQLFHTGSLQLCLLLTGRLVFHLDQDLLTAVFILAGGKQVGIRLIKRHCQRIVLIQNAHLTTAAIFLISRGEQRVRFVILRDILHGTGCICSASQRDRLAQGRHCHTGNDRRNLAANNGGCREEGTLVVTSGQHTGAVEKIDRVIVRNIGDRAIVHCVDRGQIFNRQRTGKNFCKFQTRSNAVILRQRLRKDALIQRVVHIDLIPHITLHELACTSCDSMDTGSDRHRLCEGDVAFGRKCPVAVTGHQLQLISILHIFVKPVVLRNISEQLVRPTAGRHKLRGNSRRYH